MKLIEYQKKIAFHLYFSGLLLLVASLSLSIFVISISQFIILGAWLIDGDLKSKFNKFFQNKIALLLASVYLLHLIGLIYSSDYDYAFKDLRIKLPLLLLPLILSTGPKLNRQQFEKILFALIAGVTISTLISLSIYLGIYKREIVDIRDICIFISHIRLALLCCLSIFVAVWIVYTHRKDGPGRYLLLLVPVVFWLIGFLILIESLTGGVILLLGLILFSLWALVNIRHRVLKFFIVLIGIGLPLIVVNYVLKVNNEVNQHEEVDYNNLEKFTSNGNEYYHYPELHDYENGHPIWTYQCEVEMEPAWNKRSKINYKGTDRKGQELRFTLMRFLSSKGLRKDSAGVWTLSDAEIKSVENGVANVLYQDISSLKARIHQSVWEFHHKGL